jgi:bacterioferritin-associated ferredoxin
MYFEIELDEKESYCYTCGKCFKSINELTFAGYTFRFCGDCIRDLRSVIASKSYSSEEVIEEISDCTCVTIRCDNCIMKDKY